MTSVEMASAVCEEEKELSYDESLFNVSWLRHSSYLDLHWVCKLKRIFGSIKEENVSKKAASWVCAGDDVFSEPYRPQPGARFPMYEEIHGHDPQRVYQFLTAELHRQYAP